MKTLQKLSILALTSLSFSSCDFVEEFETVSRKINHYENVALRLSKENRELRGRVSKLKFEAQKLRAEKSYLSIQLKKIKSPQDTQAQGRVIASVAPARGNDLVKFDTYKWTPSQTLAIAEKEFKEQNYDKSAQFFNTFSQKFPGHKKINDEFLFQAGVAAYESGKHPDWTLDHLGKLVKSYPTSSFYRGAKLWMALTYLNQGQEKKFFSTVEEFRKKYRNTQEWKVLSQHYEKIVQKYKH